VGNEVVGEEVRVASYELLVSRGKGKVSEFRDTRNEMRDTSNEIRGTSFESVAAILHRVLESES